MKKKILVKDILSLFNKDIVINVYMTNGYMGSSISYKDKYKNYYQVEIYSDYEVVKIHSIERNEISLYIKE